MNSSKMTLEIKRGDTKPTLHVTLYNGKTLINLSLATIKVIGTRNNVRVLEATTTGTTDGVVEYEWEPEDTSTVGTMLVELEVTFEDGGVQTFPKNGYITVAILPDLTETLPTP